MPKTRNTTRLQLPYLQPFGTPLYWMNEESGILKEALLAFLDASLARRDASEAQLALTRAYFEYIINAPCWTIDPGESMKQIAKLRERIKVVGTGFNSVQTLEALKNWIDDCLDIGIDPL